MNNDMECWASNLTNNNLKQRILNKGSIDLQRLPFLPIQAELKGNFFEIISNPQNIEEFVKRYDSNVFVRVTPNEDGKKDGLKKQYTYGVMSPKEVLAYIISTTEISPQNYTVEIRERLNFTEGFILTSNDDQIRGELGEDLEKMQHGSQVPYCSFVIDLTKVGHIEDKLKWEIKGTEKHRRELLKSLNYIKVPGDNFNPHFIRGYFEGLISKEGTVKFFKARKGELYCA